MEWALVWESNYLFPQLAVVPGAAISFPLSTVMDILWLNHNHLTEDTTFENPIIFEDLQSERENRYKIAGTPWCLKFYKLNNFGRHFYSHPWYETRFSVMFSILSWTKWSSISTVETDFLMLRYDLIKWNSRIHCSKCLKWLWIISWRATVFFQSTLHHCGYNSTLLWLIQRIIFFSSFYYDFYLKTMGS